MDQFFTESYPEPLPEERSGGLKSFVIDILQTLLLALLLYLAINATTARIQVRSVSMQPTLYEKDYVLVNKLAFRLGEPQRGDIIVFNPPLAGETEPYIKRIIGLPGDTITIGNGQVTVNGAVLQEPYLNTASNGSGTWVIPEGHLFVMGDNRNNSSDSRQWGMVSLEAVLGKGEFIYYPFNHWKSLHPPSAAAASP